MSKFVKFTKLRTSTDHTFWAKFSELKIDKYKLDEKAVINIWGSYNLHPSDEANMNPLVLDFSSFNEDVDSILNTSSVFCCGKMINKNTLEAFKETRPEAFIESLGRDIVESIKDGSSLKDPSKLSLFLLLAYSDLKKYKFYYWVAHPTLLMLPEMYYEEPQRPVNEEFTASHLEDLSKGFLQLNSKSKNYFAVLISCENNMIVTNLETGVNALENLEVYEKEPQVYNEVYFAFYDPCTSLEPGWPLRNLLSLLFWHCPTHCFTKVIKVVSIRGNKAQKSIVYKLRVKQYEDTKEARDSLFNSCLVGWESNTNGKLGPRIADLSDSMDSARRSDRAINWNLKLMKWRLVPNLDLEKISSLKCLLLGAGTLGCSVARVLLGWGVSNITFVDNSNVSHTNTVRQSLYTHQDAVDQEFKAIAAKNALLKIRPNMNAEGVVLHIPMPGHVVGESMVETTRESLEKLEELVNSSDVVFFLLDSREARWLPTVLCAATNKIAINAALGFDSFTVQRNCPSLGCYFCNDVTQPGNSQIDRTLDQQCTVSRPGLSQIAAGLAVELLVALLQHPKGVEVEPLMGHTRETINSSDAELAGLLGGVPHTIRGSLWNYDTQLTLTYTSMYCTACSPPILTEYKDRGWLFILDACNVPNYLEKLSGLERLLTLPDFDEFFYGDDDDDDHDDDDDDLDRLKDAP
ncbi:autophagy-related 7 [Halictus rubicundus]|uniref:autophagy-related 7 n=1 Tax=Halictus rubicundus TaxID=77578 RepID=UPI00403563FD